jgi:hypothetical protein
MKNGPQNMKNSGETVMLARDTPPDESLDIFDLALAGP